MHQLDITYKNTYNCKTLRIEDNSIYDDILAVKNAILEIKPPGLFHFVPFHLNNNKWKTIVLNCSSLKICNTKVKNSFTPLPDGIYEIKYSLDPNVKTMVQFDHMRVCQIMKKYIQAVCTFLSNKCNYTKKEISTIEEKLIRIKNTIDFSVWKVEECLEKQEGKDLYDEATNLLKEFEDGMYNGCSSC